MIKNALFGHFYLGTLMSTPFKMERGVKYRDAAKTSIIPVKNIDPNQELLKKPEWMKIKLPANSLKIESIKNGMRRHGLHSVCEEASCPNLHECFNHGTATFMILGAICTRRCPFCDVAHGKPLPPDPEEPQKLAETIQDMKLKYVVITSVDRDDLPDRGAGHFAYKEIRPGADYEWSLKLLREFKEMFPNIPTKSGLMVGLGETNEEILQVMQDLRDNGVTMLTLGQYLQPSRHHLPVARYVPPSEFDEFREKANEMGFEHAACGPFVRSSYHADLQASGGLVK